MHSEKDYRLHNSKSQIELEAESVAFTVLNTSDWTQATTALPMC